MATAASTVGYAATAYVSGRRSVDAWTDGQRAAVFGLFGHSNAGIFLTDEGATDADDEFLAAGLLTTRSVTVGIGGVADEAPAYTAKLGPGHWAFWKDYHPYVDVDDLSLAILAGCYTSNTSPTYGNFLDVGKQRGIDSIVGFSGLIQFPAGGCVDCNYSGNYFWDRWATYAQQGDTVAVALSKALNDLVAKYGQTYAWDTWYIGGAVAAPADVRIAPASRGVPLNSKPFGIDPFNPIGLTVIESRPLSVDGIGYVDVQTAEGVSYRQAADSGNLVWLGAPTSKEGNASVTQADALSIAEGFAREHVGWLRPDELTLTSRRQTAHQDGELTHEFIWRQMLDGVQGPARLMIQVDGRTGSIVSLSAIRVPSSGVQFIVSREDAAEAGSQVVGDAVRTELSQEVWDRPIWIVRLHRESDLFPDVTTVTLDGVSGKILSISKT